MSAAHFPEELHGLRGYVSSLDNRRGVTLEQMWVDGASAWIDLALERHDDLCAALAQAEAALNDARDWIDRAIPDEHHPTCAILLPQEQCDCGLEAGEALLARIDRLGQDTAA